MHHDEELQDHRDFRQGKKPEGDSMEKAITPFPKERAVMSICCGPTPHESQRKLKLTSRVVNNVIPATLEYFRWSESPITFD
jgi:hypothetical protein